MEWDDKEAIARQLMESVMKMIGEDDLMFEILSDNVDFLQAHKILDRYRQ